MSGPCIFFGGSASETLRAQLALLAERHGAELVTLDLEALLSGCPVLLPAPANGRPLVVNLPKPEASPDGGERYLSLQVIRAFGRLAAEVVKKSSPGTIFLSGGDTAREVLGALDLSELWIKSEISPGVVLLGSESMSVLTKSGSFGAEDLLCRLYQDYLSPGPAGGPS
jgi:uncharacterized protein YgbK (DUF1537 family)